jgi:hypothetical protein
MPSREIRSSGGQIIRGSSLLNTAINPNGQPIAVPTVKLDYRAPNGLPTTGFLFSMFNVAGGGATAGAGGFTITLWVWNPIAQRWFSFAAKTLVNYDELYETYDIDGGALIFVQVANVAVAGEFTFCFCEQ